LGFLGSSRILFTCLGWGWVVEWGKMDGDGWWREGNEEPARDEAAAGKRACSRLMTRHVQGKTPPPRPPTSPGCTTVLTSRTKGHLLKSVQVATTSVDATRGLVMSASTTSSFGGSLVFLSVWWREDERGQGGGGLV
jgi:hypothetical protein